MLDKEYGNHLYLNSLLIQHEIITDIENRLDGKAYIADSNSAFCTLLEAGATISSKAITESLNMYPSIYANIAQTSQDLYKHMSDFDYVNVFSTPASVEVILTLDTITLKNKALDFNENYRKALIPKDSVFKIGQYNFGIHYPIEIRINKFNDYILTTYNTNEMNPLMDLVQNVIEQKESIISDIPMLGIKFPIYQFTRQYLTEDAVSTIGFYKQYKYNDKFYACRIYTWKDKKWIELKQTVSDIIYDPAIATARIMIEPEINRFTVSVPQVYFTSGKIGSKILIEMYTTKGSMDIDISKYSGNSFNASFLLNTKNTSEFSKIFSNYPSIQLMPYSTKISGGSNGLTFEELKSRVINNTFHNQVLVTPTDLVAHFKDYGEFKIVKYLDNISNRIYFAHKALTDSLNSYIPCTHCNIRIDDNIINNCNSIIKYADSVIGIDGKPGHSSVTILPTTLYKYDDNSKTSYVVENDDLKVLNELSKEAYVDELNNNIYTRSPFHIHVNLNERYPYAESFNLMQPKLESIKFTAENDSITAQMVVYDVSVIHKNNGTGGYSVRLVTSKSGDLKDVPESDLLIHVLSKNNVGVTIGKPCKYLDDVNNFNIYEFELNTDYYVHNGMINIIDIDLEHKLKHNLIKLTSNFDIVFLIKKGYFPTVNNQDKVVNNLPLNIQNDYLGLSRQTMTLNLGHSLRPVLFNILDPGWTPIKYQTYEIDEYMLYPNNVYELEDNGSLKILGIDTVNNKPILNLLYKQGDYVCIDNDKECEVDIANRMILHHAGDIVFGPNGKPLIAEERIDFFLIHTLQIDAKIYASENPIQQKFCDDLVSLLETYFTSVAKAKMQILEQTEIYFRPIKTIGTATFDLGDGHRVLQSLNMSFKMKIYVPEYIYNDLLIQESIKQDVIKITEQAILTKGISMVDIANKIKEQIGDIIISIDVLGINGTIALQTIFIVDEDAQASVANYLSISKNGEITLNKSVDIEFVMIDLIKKYD